jgi:glycosyltransferase involved in cell wall biosynthesis
MIPQKRLPLIFIIPVLHYGGAERVLHEIVINLDRKRFEQHVVFFVKGDSVFRFRPDVSLHFLSPRSKQWAAGSFFSKSIRNCKTIFRLHKLLKCFPQNAILIPFFARPTTAYTILARPSIKRPVIASLHTTESIYLKFNIRNRLRCWFESKFLEFACKRSNEIVAVSEGVREDLIRKYHISPEKILVIQNPLDLDMIKKRAAAPTPFSHLFDEEKTTFVHIGRLSFEKNHRLLIEASAILRRRYENFQVLVAGTGDQEKNIRRWIEEAELTDKIFLLGTVHNPYALMAGARALLLTSLYDSSPMVLKEAMASGTAVISVDCPHGPSEILEQGRLGILVPENDPTALAHAMFDIAHDDARRESLIQKGRMRSIDYDVKQIIRAWEHLFEKYRKGCDG